MATAPKVIELMAGEVAEALKRQGIGADERVTLTILPAEEFDSRPPQVTRTGRGRRFHG